MSKQINVTLSSMPGYEEYCEEIKELWETRWITSMGVKHQQLEKDLEKYLDVPNVTLFTNGHLGLECVIASMNFPNGSEVITTPFTFVSTTQAISRNGLTPVFCDINQKNYTLDVTKLEQLITEKTVAIVPVHVYGNICDVYEIERIAKKHNLKVIYDAAHAFGVEYDGVNVSNFGDASMFSFHATKVFNTIEGGAVTFRNDEYNNLLDAYKYYGLTSQESCEYIGMNAKMTEFQAAMGICNLRHIDDEIAKRKLVWERYIQLLSGVDGILLNNIPACVKHNYSYFPVVFDNYKYTRDEVNQKLKENGINARKYFYPLTNDFECYKEIGSENTPVAKYISDRVLTLPLYADLSLEDVDRICKIILE